MHNGQDFNDLTTKQIERAVQKPEICLVPDIDWPEVQPIQREDTQEAPFPVSALPSVMRDAVESYQAYGQQPMALVASSALANAAIAVQGLVDVARDNVLISPASLNVLIVADSGERKTAADKYFCQSIKAWEQQAWEQQAQKQAKSDYKSYQSSLNIHEQKEKALQAELSTLAKRGKDTAQVEDRLHSLSINQPEPVIIPNWLYEDITYEGYLKAIESGWPSTGLFSDEGGLVVGSYGMKDENRTRFLALINRMWESGQIKIHRGQAENRLVEGKRLTCCLMMQPSVLQKLTVREEARNIGFLARFLICQPTSTKGSRFYKAPVTLYNEFHNLISELLTIELNIEGENNCLKPTLIHINDDAKPIWEKYHNEIEAEMAAGGAYSELSDFASKSPEQAVRIAAIFQVIESGIGNITPLNMQCGITIAKWYLNEAKRLLLQNALSAEEKNALALWNWLANTGRQIFLPSEISQYAPNAVRKAHIRDAAIDCLIEHGYVAPVAGNFYVNPNAITRR